MQWKLNCFFFPIHSIQKIQKLRACPSPFLIPEICYRWNVSVFEIFLCEAEDKTQKWLMWLRPCGLVTFFLACWSWHDKQVARGWRSSVDQWYICRYHHEVGVLILLYPLSSLWEKLSPNRDQDENNDILKYWARFHLEKSWPLRMFWSLKGLTLPILGFL